LDDSVPAQAAQVITHPAGGDGQFLDSKALRRQWPPRLASKTPGLDVLFMGTSALSF
jgi:hypothetical protein